MGGADGIPFFEPAIFQISEDILPYKLALTDDHRIHMGQRLFRQGWGMDTAHDYGNTTLTKGIRHLIGTWSNGGLGRKSYKPHLCIKIDYIAFFIYNPHLILIRCDPGKIGQIKKTEFEDKILIRPTISGRGNK